MTMQDTCARCGKRIELRQTAPTSKTFRWFSSSQANAWHCGDDPNFPVRSHAPVATKLPAEQSHDYESERGALEPTGLCTVCGTRREAAVHA